MMSRYASEKGSDSNSQKIAQYILKMKEMGLLNPEARSIKLNKLPGIIR